MATARRWTTSACGRFRGITSAANDDLTRTTAGQPLEPRLRMRGMYRYMADAGRFTECLTRETWPVAHERDNAVLEAAYATARRGARAGTARRPGSPGGHAAQNERRRPPAIARRRAFRRSVARRTCGWRTSTEPLENTYWKLTRLGTTPVNVGSGGEDHAAAPRRVRYFGEVPGPLRGPPYEVTRQRIPQG